MDKVIKMKLETPQGVTESEFHTVCAVAMTETEDGKSVSSTTVIDGIFSVDICIAMIHQLSELQKELVKMMLSQQSSEEKAQ